MKIFIIISLILTILIIQSKSKECPCSNVELCKPLEIGPRKEFIGFSVNSTFYPYYNWDHLTTIGIFYSEDIEDELLCMAKTNGVRLVYSAFYPVEQLSNETYIDQWINEKLELVQNTFTDGLNFDVEYPITDPIVAQQYTQLVAATNNAFKSVNLYYQISVDVAWDASNCIDYRCYDYLGLSKASDFLVVMDYDMKLDGYYFKTCLASANSPPSSVLSGMVNFTKLGIDESSLVMGLPWYGYNYPCIGSNYTLQTFECIIPPSSYLGYNCTDASGIEINYSIIMNMLNDTAIQNGGVQWDSESESPYFNFIDLFSGTQHQMWFDNPDSLTIKVNIARTMNLRGVGVWNIDQLWDDHSLSSGMWGALNSFFKIN
ncbi:glycoside hydrolase family 18 protein [Dictyostelium discoideum AX4]|uniref:Probable di-N-acetylchitobiase 1 n=1 Tax=Dictyostelium discoideum TaxID=44689 RepID=DIAC1_DICDI|nr:glycoside hydrolase family 18 protein [Dictyostelium discoideum AX4]Q7KWW8.1 RecName: Full=Probable di-N-acetylchitobiase 1; Flags: Precursor [Dictyostelium discoideum]EAL68899.1 glycoside hydrolase family 18 protein [Dictyostelium discoideum AX4]|eukprot:XP_642876.1 glycoside hydrolase family 18 protein [Dictyostelium discoideum AX4]